MDYKWVFLYSFPVVTVINWAAERSLQDPYTSQGSIVRTRLLANALSILAVISIHQSMEREYQKKISEEDKEFLQQWGHIRSPYHSSSSESDVTELITY
jgi:hypothetical protein